MWILANGGLHRSRSYWDSSLRPQENRRKFRYLDRAHDEGNDIESLAEEIGYSFPWYRIENGDDLWDWLEETG
jgi:hypothetical protein